MLADAACGRGQRRGRQRPFRIIILLLGLVLLGAACQSELAPEQTGRRENSVRLLVDGGTLELTTSATTVRELLAEAGVSLEAADEVDPPLFTPLTDQITEVRVVRVTESLELIQRAVPFDRKVVRNEAMSADDPPVIIQAGRTGLEELTVRIIYRDGLETERLATQAVLVEEPQDEIVMVGLGAAAGNVRFTGRLAFISGGNSLIMRGSSALPEQLNTGGNLDRRVFTLSPTGSHLLYTRAATATSSFNSLWLLSTAPGSVPIPLGVENVLWAGWNPARELQIAYTTGVKTELLPGWEANNDLWLGDVAPEANTPLDAEQLIESYPATYGWWGGHFAWSPEGRYLAYSYADEVGLIDLTDGDETPARRQLQRFTEYNTRAEWVWVPSLSWSPDSRYLAFTSHAGDNAEGLAFDVWAVDTVTGVSGRFVGQSGIWGHPHWSPAVGNDETTSQIAYLKATNPLDSLRSSYSLWLMDQDGSNGRQIYPPAGENSRFPRDRQFMAWGATGQELAFIFNDDLYLLNLDEGLTYRLTQDDNIVSHPTWAPYGMGVDRELPATTDSAGQ